MTYPPPPGGWQDPLAAGPQSGPPAVPSQPGPADPYAPMDPYAPIADPKSPYAPPGGEQYAPPMPAYPPPAYPGYAMPAAATNSLAIVALVLALVGIVSCITAPIGAIMGHVARRQIRETGEQGDGMALAAIIVGWLVSGLVAAFILLYIVIGVIVIGAATSSNGGY
ncbi:DUF4190 domain-containing protein [Micromonospora sp. NPDC005686]|uniref:DUF4190 domain-containing protein n=1 Tax=unclassified Micromonospora TaxID=2617518 RepID=UPI0033AC47F2